MRLVLCSLLLSWVAGAEPVKERATGHTFDSVMQIDGRPFVLVGAAVRKKEAYAMALYVEEADGRHAFPALVSRAGGRDHAKLVSSDHAQSFVMWGSFGKVGILHFVSDVEADKIRKAFAEGLEEEMSDKVPAERKSAAQQFLALFDKDMKEGQQIKIRTWADGKIEVDVAGQKKLPPQSAKLARAVWGIWLGAKSISTDLRRGLVERIDVLGKP